MKSTKKHILFISILLLTSLLISCEWVKELPILKVPDGNKDRMLKRVLISDENNQQKYWISKVTVVKTSFGSSGGFPLSFQGIQSTAKLGYFEFTRNKLKFNNAVTRQSLESLEIASQGIDELINEWDIKHSSFRLAEVDGYTTNREEENNYIPWHEKEYFTVDWSKADISEANTFPYLAYASKRTCWKKKTASIIDSSREITEDYIGFTIAIEYEQEPACSNLQRHNMGNYTHTVHYKYSFKRVPNPYLEDQNYTPYIYAGEEDPLLKKYGYFRTVRPIIAEDNRDKNIFYMDRWNPNKKHIFYFTKDYPDEYKDIAHGVICHTNKLFAKHNLNNYPLNGKCKEDGSVLAEEGETCSTGICFELRENTGQEFGDIRYSFFHMLSSAGGILGYGPHDTHPATGEIISGNIVVSTHLLDFFLKYLVNDKHLRDQTKYENSSLFERMRQSLESIGEDNHEQWTHTSELIDKDSEIRPDFEYLVSQLTFGHPGYSQFTNSRTNNPTAQLDFHFDEELLIPNMPKNIIEKTQSIIESANQDLAQQQFQHESNATIYPLEPVISQIPKMLSNGMTAEEAKRRILFNLMTHEFGHVLNLRHNFYGSVDTRHWHEGHEDETLKTSSVMDYLDIQDEVAGPPRALFGSYDEAALVYAYSGGEKDLSIENNTQYLFCTDHHVSLNFLCNRWDQGSTPSEIIMSLIEGYEENYFLRNLRIDRAYWDTRNYPYQIFRIMFDMKRPLLMWQTAFNDGTISEVLSRSKVNYTEDDINKISNHIQKDIKQAIKLSVAFYNGVLQISSADRDWKDSYNDSSGAIEKIGIAWDKIFAMLFLMGDGGFYYNPNYYLGNASYLTYIDDLGFRQLIEETMENTLTVRVDMSPLFIGFGRLLYAENASNYYNINAHGDLLERIAVRCYTPKGLQDRFGIDPYNYQANENSPPDFLDTALVSMEDYVDKITDPYYRGTNEQLGITFFDGNYYVASSHLNKYSFSIIKRMKTVIHSYGGSLRLAKQDVYDVFSLYHLKKKGFIPTSCDDGNR